MMYFFSYGFVTANCVRLLTMYFVSFFCDSFVTYCILYRNCWNKLQIYLSIIQNNTFVNKWRFFLCSFVTANWVRLLTETWAAVSGQWTASPHTVGSSSRTSNSPPRSYRTSTPAGCSGVTSNLPKMPSVIHYLNIHSQFHLFRSFCSDASIMPSVIHYSNLPIVFFYLLFYLCLHVLMHPYSMMRSVIYLDLHVIMHPSCGQ